MGELKLYFSFLRMHLRSGLEYRGWWLMVLQTLLVCVLDPLGTVLLFLRFGSIGEWTMERILLVYALAVQPLGRCVFKKGRKRSLSHAGRPKKLKGNAGSGHLPRGTAQ